MNSNLWNLNGQSVKISSSGVLDGRHRLKAGSNSKKGFPTFVMYSIPSHTYTSMDQGLNRTLAQLIGQSMSNNMPTKELSSVVRGCCVYDNTDELKVSISGKKSWMGNDQLLEYLRDNPHIHETIVPESVKLINDMRSLNGQSFMDMKVMGVFWHALMKKGYKKEIIKTFLNSVCISTPEGVCRLLRKKLVEIAQLKRDRKPSLSSNTIFLLVLHSFKYWYSDTDVRRLKTPHSVTIEPFEETTDNIKDSIRGIALKDL